MALEAGISNTTWGFIYWYLSRSEAMGGIIFFPVLFGDFKIKAIDRYSALVFSTYIIHQLIVF